MEFIGFIHIPDENKSPTAPFANYTNLSADMSKFTDSGVTVGIQPETVAEFLIYPNPTSGNLFVNLTNVANETSIIEITDLAGRRLYYSSFYGLSYECNLDGLADGMYMVHILNGTDEYYKKIIVH